MSREGWQGFVYVAFVIDTFADRIVGPLSADLAMPNRLPVNGTGLAVRQNGLCSPLSCIAAQYPAGQWMLWSRPCMIGGRSRKVDWFTIRTASLGTLLHNALPGSGQAIFVHSIHRAFG